MFIPRTWVWWTLIGWVILLSAGSALDSWCIANLNERVAALEVK